MTDHTARQVQYLTPAEVAEDLRVSPATVHRWIDAGDLPALQLGRRTKRIFAAHYAAFKAARHAEAADRASAPVPHVPGQLPLVPDTGATDGLAAL